MKRQDNSADQLSKDLSDRLEKLDDETQHVKVMLTQVMQHLKIVDAHGKTQVLQHHRSDAVANLLSKRAAGSPA